MISRSLRRAGGSAGVVVLTCLCVLAVAGCGSGSSTTGSPAVGTAAPPLPKAKFLSQGNALCSKAVKEQANVVSSFVEAGQKSGKTLPPSAIEDLAREKILPIANRMVDELEELGAPTQDRDRVNKVLDEFKEGIALAEEAPSEYWAGRAFKSADALAASYGLAKCGV
jgi:hypothetical protein